MIRWACIVILAISALLLAACGGAAPAPNTATTSPSPNAASDPLSSQASSTPASSDPIGGANNGQIVTFTRSGGFAGRTNTLVVQPDGTLEVRNGDVSAAVAQTAQASPDQLAALQTALQSAEWQQLDASYGEQVPDGFAYSIEGGGKQVQTYDGASNPPILDTVIDQMSELLAKVQAQ